MNAFPAGASASNNNNSDSNSDAVANSGDVSQLPTPATAASSTSLSSTRRLRPSASLSVFTSTGSTNALSRLAAASSSLSTGALTPPHSATPLVPGSPRSPVRFAATTDAFGLYHSHPTHSDMVPFPTATLPQSPTSSASPTATATPARRLRRPSLLSLAPPKTQPVVTADTLPDTILEPDLEPTDDEQSPLSASQMTVPPQPVLPTETIHPQPTPRWGVSPLTSISGTPSRVGSAPPISFEGLTTRASPVMGRRSGETMDDLDSSPLMEKDDRSLWGPSELERRRSSNINMDGDERRPSAARLPFSGRPLPGALLATLISESSPLEHEMRSEARYQRLISSHPSVFPLTPRQRRNTRWTRGRFPEMVGDDDDDDDDPRGQPGSRWVGGGSSDTDSDEVMFDSSAPEWQPNGSSLSSAAGAVNSAFASVMDLDRGPDRPASSGSSGWMSGKSTPSGRNNGNGGNGNGNGSGNGSSGTPSQWKNRASSSVAPSPGSGLQLPTAFGGLAMGNNGTASATATTPLGSPTAEKTELGCSPNMMPTTPGMMQYREPTSGRPGKRKAVDDRFDPYKRPRGSSPSPFQSAALSPQTSAAIAIPPSPSRLPLVGSALALGSPGYLSLSGAPRKNSAYPHTHSHGHSVHHPYTRPMTSRSRAASPALSIGSTSGVLSTSLGNGGLTGPSRPLTGPFIPTGAGAAAAVNAASAPGAAPGTLGSLGFLSLAGEERAVKEEDEVDEDAMEEG